MEKAFPYSILKINSWNIPFVTRVNTEKIQVTRGIFHGIPLESVA